MKILLRAETGFRSEVEAERPHQAPVVVLAQGVAVGVVPADIQSQFLGQLVLHADIPSGVFGAAVSGVDAVEEGFRVRSLQEYAVDRNASR